MAKDAKPAEEGAETPKKSKKLLIIILAAVLVIVLAGVAQPFSCLKERPRRRRRRRGRNSQASEEKRQKKEKDAPPVFVNLEPFTVNLIPETGDQYLQVFSHWNWQMHMQSLTSRYKCRRFATILPCCYPAKSL